jgi:hypothetical protein
MMKRILLTFALLIGLAAPAYAQEINADVGCDSPAAWPMIGSGWSVTGSKCVATSVTRMAMLGQMPTAIKKGHNIKVTFDATVSSGILRAFVGVKMPSAVTGTTIPLSSVSAISDTFTTSLGLTTAGTVLRSTTGPGDDPERNGSMRVSCISGGFGRVDPLVYFGVQSPHAHEFYGATNMQPNWTYSDFRTKAQSSCTNATDPNHTINRSGYWAPAVIDGNGNYKRSGPLLIYYKGPSNPAQPATVTLTGNTTSGSNTLVVTATGGVTNPISPDGEYVTGSGIPTSTQIDSQISGTPLGIGSYHLTHAATATATGVSITLMSPHKAGGEADGTAATMCSDYSFAGNCQNVPRSLAFTFGYKGSFNATATPDNNCGPDDLVAVGTLTTERCSINGLYGWRCIGGPNGEGAAAGTEYTSTYPTLHAIMAAGVCANGSWVSRNLQYPTCWDGVNVLVPDHRSNMSWGNTNGACKIADHPVRLIQISLLLSYRVDPTFLAGKWHLSSDEMAACYDTNGLAGCTDHADYWEAWSDSVRDTWYTHCDFPHNSCTNDLGDGTALKFVNLNSDGSANTRPIFGAIEQSNDTTAPMALGFSRDITASGSYTYYINSVDDGVFGFMGLKGLTGTVDNIHVTDLGATAKGPVTVHN